MDVRTFELVGNLLPQAMLLVESSGLIRAANRWAATSLALVDGEVAGQDLAGFSCDRADSLRGFLGACAPGREPRVGRLRFRGRDGRLRVYVAFGAALPAADVEAGPLVLLSLAESTPADGGDLHEPWQPEELHQRLDAVRRSLEEQQRIRWRLHHLHLQVTRQSQPPWQPDDLHRQLAEEARWRREFAEEICRLQEATLCDELTGLANRTLFRDRLD
ncbi:MAG TPA: hypothetical protein VFG47_09165, partial [Geminicoccaceae bacterium]|nr:hypothetical protein [Geminicoccaceae bacterium]